MLIIILLFSALLHSAVRCNTTGATVTAAAATQRAASSSASNGPTALAAELDMLLPPADMADRMMVGVADVSIVPDTDDKPDEDDDEAAAADGASKQLPTWLHSYHGPIIAAATVVLLLMMALATHFLWRRHIERHAADWETENTRILCGTSYYLDRSQIFVY